MLTRVTGSNASEILGRLGTFQVINNQFAPSNANFFLVNPNGVIFGPNSSLDIGGSVVVTTANALQFPNGELFSATVPTIPSSVLTVDPSALLYNAINAQNKGIVVRSALTDPNNLIGQTFGLQVPKGQSLLLVGGAVKLEGGFLQAPGGRVELGGLSELGTVGLTKTGGELRLQFADGVVRSDISLINSLLGFSGVAVAADGGGSIAINAQNLDILGDSQLQSGITSGLRTSTIQAGDITIDVISVLRIEGGGVDNAVLSGATGDAGDVIINTGSLNVTNGAQLTSSTFGQGNAGDVVITVRDTATFDGVGINGPSAAGSQVSPNAVGNSGILTLTAGSLNVTSGARLTSSTFGQGNAGDVAITVRDTATFDGVGSNGSISGAGSSVNATGLGGRLTLSAGSLSVINGAQLTSSTFGQGNAGAVTITVRDTATFDGVGSNGFSSAVGSIVAPNAVGNGGRLNLTAGSLNVTNGATLTSSTFGQGNAGDVAIIVRDTATFDGVGSDGSSSAVAGQVAPNALGKGGTLNLTAGSLNVTNGATLTSSTFGQGNAGDVAITVRDTATFDGAGSNRFVSGAGSEVGLGAVGNGGTLTLTTGSLNVTNGAQLTSSTSGEGNAGNVLITVRDTATFDGVGSSGKSSGVGSTVGVTGVGNAGTLTLTADSLNVTNRAVLSSSTLGQGNARDIVLRIRESLQVTDGTIATVSLSTSGGNIDIVAKSIRLSGDGDITTSVFGGAGGGGNITLTAKSIVALNDSDILAFARDGKGGNVTLNTRAFFGQNYRPAPFGTDPATLDGNDRVDINATGTLSSGIIQTPDTSFIQNGLNQLPKDAIDTTKLLSQTCIVRKDKPNGTFYITGTGGLPNRPSDPSLSNYPTNTIAPTQTAIRPWQKGDPIVEPQGFYTLTNGRLIMSRECQNS